MQWTDVVKRDDIVGGDLETQEDGSVFRGPISAISIEGNQVAIRSSWVAKMVTPGRWVKISGSAEIFVDVAMGQPSDIGQGRVSFPIPFLGLGVIFPKGGSKLDPAKVEGL